MTIKGPQVALSRSECFTLDINGEHIDTFYEQESWNQFRRMLNHDGDLEIIVKMPDHLEEIFGVCNMGDATLISASPQITSLLRQKSEPE